MSDRENRREELDSFWDIEMLVPPKKEPKKSTAVSFDTSTASVDLPAREGRQGQPVGSSRLTPDRGGSTITRFIPPHTPDELTDRRPPELEYELQDSLIRRVRIYGFQTKYVTTDRFITDAERLFKLHGEEAPRVPFFSYSPQYSQMNRSQLAWYLWWRENFRRGVSLDTDYSYILLYVYELINLSPRLDKQYCLDRMCRVWLEYGERYQFIGKYLCEWICDFCLIHRLAPPSDTLKDVYPFVLKNALLKEFYIYGDMRSEGIGAETLMSVCSAYDYKKSRYATPDRLPVMEEYMKNVLNRVIARNSTSESPLSGFGFSDNSVIRTSYTSAFCAPIIRKRIEVEYCSFSRSHELRYLVADVLRYTENKLRASWGIRSRLSIYALPTGVRECIDEYFGENPIRRADDTDRNGRRIVNEYDKLYDVPKVDFSAENAAKIEKASWDTTRILVEAFEDDGKEMKQTEVANSSEPEPIVVVENNENDVGLRAALGEKYEFLLAALAEDRDRQKQVAARLSAMPDAIADEINELAAELLGDILLEEDDMGGFRVIEEYREVIK